MSSMDVVIYTEREVIGRERLAYTQAIAEIFAAARSQGGIEYVDVRGWADRAFPLPKITRPRIVDDPHFADIIWRVCDNQLEAGKRTGGSWTKEPWEPTWERVALWADLLAHPTETVGESE